MPRHLTLEVAERFSPPARCATPLDRGRRRGGVRATLAREGVEAVAVCFLHSYANPSHERAPATIMRAALPDAYVSLSHEILREYREYERTSTTVVNAYIGPQGRRLRAQLCRQARGDRLSRRALDHAVERRRDDAGSCAQTRRWR